MDSCYLSLLMRFSSLESYPIPNGQFSYNTIQGKTGLQTNGSFHTMQTGPNNAIQFFESSSLFGMHAKVVFLLGVLVQWLIPTERG